MREPSSFLFVNGVSYRYKRVTKRLLGDSVLRVGDTEMKAHKLLSMLRLKQEIAKHRTPVIAYGSNAAPTRLTQKFFTPAFSGEAVIPTMKASLRDYDIVWGPWITSAGGLASNIVFSKGTEVEVWINWLDGEQLARMNATEDVGRSYSVGRLNRPQLKAQGVTPHRPMVYVDCRGALRSGKSLLAVANIPARHRRFPGTNARGALATTRATFGWKRSVFELVLDSIKSPERRERRTWMLQKRTAKARLPRYTPLVGCSAR